MASKVKLTDELKRELDIAWLNLEKHEIEEAYNPLRTFRVDEDNPHIHVIQQFISKENFYLTCKFILGIELHTFQLLILQELWMRKFPMLIASRGAGKTFILAILSILIALLKQGSKVIITGAGFRQAKLVFEEIERIWNNSPIFRDICMGYNAKRAGSKKDADRWVFFVGQSTITAIPAGGDIRGLRSTATICDEFQSVNTDVFETVIAGFSAVNLSPIERVKNRAKNKLLAEKGYIEEDEEFFKNGEGNQTILAGTCTYNFQKFYEYWKRYRDIILSKGDKKKLIDALGEIPTKFDWKDYAVIRYPYELLPDEYMDDKNIARTKATITKDTFAREYQCVFTTDSDGFFKRSLIETCVCNDKLPIMKGTEVVKFAATLVGNKAFEYVYGVDPASENDNFSIIILELRGDHRRVVYSWTMTRGRFKKLCDLPGGPTEQNFYAYCVRKIRELTKVFPTRLIGIDTQGGGIPIEEAFKDTDKMGPNELPIYPIIDREKPSDTDGKSGLHYLVRAVFANAEWVANANYGLKKDLEEKVVIFPFFDPISVFDAYQTDLAAGREFDTYEDCVMSIEELKAEMTSIIHSRTQGGRERWDTPDTKGPDGKGRKQRKDRYSALLIANMVARTFQRMDKVDNVYHGAGGFAQTMGDEELKSGADLYHKAPEWFKNGIDYCGAIVIRGGNG